MTAEGGERRRRLVVVGAGALLALVTCGAAGWLLGRTVVPDELRVAEPVTRVAIAHEEFTDTRTVDLALTLQPSAGMVLRVGGVLTASRCRPGAEVASGGSTFAVDGAPLIDLRTSQPLWRPLPLGARGADVRSVQEALVAVGFTGPSDGIMGPQTLDYFNALRRRVEPAAPLVAEISPDSVVWLGEAPTRIADCVSSVGQPLETGAILASLPPRLTALRVGTMPAAVPDRPRTISIDAVQADVDGEGVVDPESWTAVADTPSFRRYVADPESVVLKGTLQTASAIPVALVPPSALFSISDDEACVTDGSSSFRGAIISTESGFALVEFPGEGPTEVELSPAPELPCP